MRFVLIGPVFPFRGGIAHYTTMLYRALKACGYDVLLISFSRQYPDRLFPGSSDRDPSGSRLGIDEAQFWIDSMNPLTWLKSFVEIRRYKPDRIILQWWSAFWTLPWVALGLLNALFLRCPIVHICHNVVPHELHWYDTVAARFGLMWADSYILHSESERKQLVALFGGGRTLVRPIPVYDFLAADRLPRREARERLGLAENGPVLLFFGFIRAYKGLEDLIMAMPIVRVSEPDVILLIAGEFWEDKRDYQCLIDSLDLGTAVLIDDRYIPNEDVAVYFSAADILAAPYRSVTGSAVVQMGRGFGLPIVTTRVGSMSEIAEQDPAVNLADPHDPQSLAEAVLVCLRNTRGFVRAAISPASGCAAQTMSVEWTNLARDLAEL